MAEKDAELVRLRADAQRLDWLDARGEYLPPHQGAGAAKVWNLIHAVAENEPIDTTLRAAIDAARHSSEGTPCR